MSTTRIREAIDKLASVFAANPEKARVKNTMATARLTAGLKCEVTGPGNERVLTDMPPGVGGEGTAPNPSWLLRSGMASCTATVIAMRAAKLGIDLRTLEVTVESESDQRGSRPSVTGRVARKPRNRSEVGRPGSGASTNTAARAPARAAASGSRRPAPECAATTSAAGTRAAARSYQPSGGSRAGRRSGTATS